MSDSRYCSFVSSLLVCIILCKILALWRLPTWQVKIFSVVGIAMTGMLLKFLSEAKVQMLQKIDKILNIKVFQMFITNYCACFAAKEFVLTL